MVFYGITELAKGNHTTVGTFFKNPSFTVLPVSSCPMYDNIPLDAKKRLGLALKKRGEIATTVELGLRIALFGSFTKSLIREKK